MNTLAAVPYPADDSSARAASDLAAARERLAQQLTTLEAEGPPAERLRRLVQTHPAAALGGAFLVGYGIGRLLRRR